MVDNLLEIKELHVQVEDKEILRGLSLSIKKGEIHAIMGPNGSGKSTLSNALLGHPKYSVTKGKMYFQGQDLSELETNERANRGIFLGFQYPKEIPGVKLSHFLRSSLNSKLKYENAASDDGTAVGVLQFKKMMDESISKLKINPELSKRFLNTGFSGGEKKKSEILQMSILKPKLSILDEIDSGLDIDAIKAVAEGVVTQKEANPDMSILLITHYQRILNYIPPDHVHVLYAGKIIKSGGRELAHKLEEKGYDGVIQEYLAKKK